MRSCSRRSAAALVLAAALTTATLACGIPEENEPRAVAPERVPDQLQTVPPASPTSVDEVGQTEIVYVIGTDEDGEAHLVSQEVFLETDASPRSLVAALLGLETSALREELQTVVPGDLEIIDSENDRDGVEVDDDLVRIRLNDELQNIQAETLTQAFAQIVWTATQVGGVERVQLIDVNDDPIPVTGTNDPAAKEVVTRADFAELRPVAD